MTLSLGACSSDDEGGDPGGPTGAWRLLEELRDAARQSPDHLVAEAARLAKTGDVDALVAFVQSRISTYPGELGGFGPVVVARRWGTDWTLRGGAGTPREKADLLVALLTQAGVTAEVVTRGLDLDAEAAVKRFAPAKVVPFKPGISESRAREIGRGLGASTPRDASPDFPDGTTPASLAEKVLAALPEDRRPVARFDLTPPTEWPFVRITTNGGTRLADPCGSSAAGADDPGAAPAPGPGETGGIRVSLSLARSRVLPPAGSAADVETVKVVERDWPVDQFVGRQIVATFTPVVRPGESVALLAPATVQAFLPTLAVRGDNLDATAAYQLSLSGTPFVRDGALVEPAADEAAAAQEPDASAVTRVEVVARADTFPDVVLEVRARDRAGAPVPGLDARSFVVDEDGTRLGFRAEGEGIARRRLLFLCDNSDSMPVEFREAALAPVLAQIAEAAAAATSEPVEFRVAAVDGLRAVALGEWTADAAAAVGQLERIRAGSSDLWHAAASAGALGATAVVLVTDAFTFDGPTDGKAQIAAGPPLHVLHVGGEHGDVASALAAAGNGKVVRPGGDVATRVASLLESSPIEPYRLYYRAPQDGDPSRTVRVRAGSGEGTAEYDAPAAPVLPPSIVGLLLTVTYNDVTVTRCLAGLDPRTGAAPTAAHVADVLHGLFGSYELSFEAGAPSDGQVFDDALSYVLATRPLFTAAAKSRDALAKALGEDHYLMASTRHALSARVPASPDDPLTFEAGLRVILNTSRPAPGASGTSVMRKAVDVLPVTRFATVSSDPAVAARATAERSAVLALSEALLMPDNTVTGMGNAKLVLGPFEGGGPPLDSTRPADVALQHALASWQDVRPFLLVAEDHRPYAWAVDYQTGTLWGVIGSGAGGGQAEEDTRRDFSRVQALLNLLALSNDIAGVLKPLGSFSMWFGVWAALEGAKTGQVLRATIAILLMDDPGGGPGTDLCQAGQEIGVEIITAILRPFLGEAAELIAGYYQVYDGTLSTLDGNSTCKRLVG